MDPSSTVYPVSQAVLIQLSSCFCPPVLAMATGPWCSSAAATDTHAGGVRASRASSGTTGRPSSETTASARLHRSRRTSQPSGKTAAGGWEGQAFPSLGILGGKKTAQTRFTLLFVKKTLVKSSNVVCFPCLFAVAMETYEQPPLSSPSLRLLFIASPSAGRGRAAESFTVTTESNNLYSRHPT